jgi:hypothetical protein
MRVLTLQDAWALGSSLFKPARLSHARLAATPPAPADA